jgi:hypothetical protein
MKGLAILIGGIVLGNYVFETFILKKQDGSGFIEQTDGLGLDEVARAGASAAAVILLRKFI